MYEYVWVNFDQVSLNQMGAEGWRVIPGMIVPDRGYSVMMEREVPQVSEPTFPTVIDGETHMLTAKERFELAQSAARVREKTERSVKGDGPLFPPGDPRTPGFER